MNRAEATTRLAALRARADRPTPESWVPENPGDEIAGKLARYERGSTAYGEQVIAVIQPLEGPERSVWLLQTVLLDEFRKLRPRPGELLLVRYLGKKTPTSGGPAYQAYRVELDRDDEIPEWATLDGEERPQPTEPTAPTAGATTGVHEPLEPPAPQAAAASNAEPDQDPDDDIPF